MVARPTIANLHVHANLCIEFQPVPGFWKTLASTWTDRNLRFLLSTLIISWSFKYENNFNYMYQIRLTWVFICYIVLLMESQIEWSNFFQSHCIDREMSCWPTPVLNFSSDAFRNLTTSLSGSNPGISWEPGETHRYSEGGCSRSLASKPFPWNAYMHSNSVSSSRVVSIRIASR